MSTLYVSGHDTHVAMEARHLVLEPSGKNATGIPRKIPLHEIDRLAVVGAAHVSMAVLRRMLRQQKPVILLTPTGGLIGSFLPARDGDAGLRVHQYERARDEVWKLETARSIIHAKILNSRRVLQKQAAGADGQNGGESIRAAVGELELIANRSERASEFEALRGHEGAAAALYFEILRGFFPAAIPFVARRRRPATDPANALMSWTYSIALNEIYAAICLVGLDPCLGSLHGLGYGRPSLALDLLEPFRAPLCDLFVLRLLNLRVLDESHFEKDAESGACVLTEEGRRRFFVQYEERMQRPFKRRDAARQTTLRGVIADVVQDYVKALRNRECVRPFRMA